MHKFLPSKKFIRWTAWSVGAMAILFLVGNFIQGRWEIFQTGNDNGVGGQLNVTFKDVVERDTDGDGLLDWEEALWGMDPKNPDTNGDGISDGAEAEAQRRALNIGAETEPASAGEETKQTMTDNFAKELLVTVLALEQSGNLTEENLQKITDAFEKEIKNSERTAKYGSKDLELVADKPEMIGKYAYEMNGIIKEYPVQDEGVMAVIERALTENSVEELEKIDPVIRRYQSMTGELLAVEVPRGAVSAHLRLANSVYNLTDDFQSMRVVYDDPIRAFLAIIRHGKTLEDYRLALAGLSGYFQSVKSTLSL